MNKSIRTLIIAGVIVVLLGGAAAFLLNLPDSNDTEKKSQSGDILLYDKTSLDAEEITVDNSGGEYTLVGFSYKDQAEKLKKAQSEAAEESETSEEAESSENVRKEEESAINIYMHYTMQGYEELDVAKDEGNSLSYCSSYVSALEIVDKSGNKYKDYGLDSPRSTVKVVFSDNSTETLYIGNDAPDNKGVYFRRDGNANVYLMQVENAKPFLVEKLQMFDKAMTKDLDSEAEIATLDISGTAYEKEIKIDRGSDIASAATYKMRSPSREVAALDSVEKIAGSLFGMTGTWVEAVLPDKDTIKKYGLDKPYMELKATASDKSKADILVSKAEKDGSCYAMIPGGKTIFRMQKEDVEKWYGIKYEDLLAATFILPNTPNITRADITSDGKRYDYRITHTTGRNDNYEEYTKTTVKLDGKEVGFSNLSIFIDNVSRLTRKGVDIKSLDGYTEIFSICFEYDSEDKSLKDDLRIYKNDKGSYVVKLNGNIEGYTDRDDAQELISQVPKITGSDQLEYIGEKKRKDAESSAEEEKKVDPSVSQLPDISEDSSSSSKQ